MDSTRDRGTPPSRLCTPCTATAALRAHGLRVSTRPPRVLTALSPPIDRSARTRSPAAATSPRSTATWRRSRTIGLVRHVHLGHGPGRYTWPGARLGGRARTAAPCAPSRPTSSTHVRAAVHEASASTPRFTPLPGRRAVPACAAKDDAMTRARAPARRVAGLARRRPRACTSSASALLFGLVVPQHLSLGAGGRSASGVGHHGLHARPAPRVRRRPHRGDRQHHAQADERRAAAAERRVLLLARALDRRVRARAAASRSASAPWPATAERRLDAAAVTGARRHGASRGPSCT